MHTKKIEKATVLVEALPYIRKFFGKTVVVKYGGSLVMSDEQQTMFAKDIALLKYVGMHPVVVHGGGKEISKWVKKVGKEPVFIDGLRFTDSETMEITEMVLSGKINSQIVSAINQNGGKAVGLSGKDANLFTGKKIRSKSNQDLGLVGDIDNVDTVLLNTLSEKGYIPVVSSIGISNEGESLNLNADHVAAGIAKALGVLKLVFMTDVPGLLINGDLVPSVSLKEAKEFRNHPDVQGGMLPKLNCVIDALEGGVESVHIVNGKLDHAVLLEMFTDVGIGTMFLKKERS
ncbi:MAG: acetylglutamate kinase [Candidatus Margulisiibacteriota bacterium]